MLIQILTAVALLGGLGLLFGLALAFTGFSGLSIF